VRIGQGRVGLRVDIMCGRYAGTLGTITERYAGNGTYEWNVYRDRSGTTAPYHSFELGFIGGCPCSITDCAKHKKE